MYIETKTIHLLNNSLSTEHVSIYTECLDLPKDMRVIECYYGSVLGSWCSVSCSSSNKHQVVACIVDVTSPNTDNSGAPMLAWNVTVANTCTSPADSSASMATTAAFSSTTRTGL